MKAIVCTAYGAPEVLQIQEWSKPIPRANEVLVRVQATPVTTADGMMRKGTPFYARFFLGLLKPSNPIPGTGFAGIIESVGKKVTRFRVGEAVFGETALGFGANAEYLCVPEDGIIVKKPEQLSFAEAAPVCDGALTALNFLRNIAQIPRDPVHQSGRLKILINGASGSIGTSAVQLAKYFGAEVTGVCGPNNVELVRSLGADQVIDYTKTDFTQATERYDIVFDTVGKNSFGQSKKVLKARGQYLSPVLNLPLLFQMLWTAKSKGQKAKFDATGLRSPEELRLLLLELRELLEAGHLRMVMDRQYAMNQVAEAHRYVDQGHKRGNVVMVV